MSLSRTFSAATAFGMTAVLALSACGTGSGGGGDGQEVDFGYIGDYNGTSLLAIAKDQKIWEKHGLKVNAKVFTNGPLQIQALGTGDLDVGYIGPGAFWLPASGQAKIIAMNTLGNADRVIAQGGTTSLAQLRGKTVGVPEGTSGDMILTLALKQAGLTKKDIKVVNMDPSTIVSAFSSKRIQAAGFWYPAIATIKKQVPDLTELAKNSDFESQMAFPTAFVAGNKFVSGDKDKAAKTIAALREAMQYRTAHMDKSIELTAKMLHAPAETVKADAANVKVLSVEELDTMTKDGTIDKWLTRMGGYFVGAGKLKSSPDPKTYYTGDLFTAGAK
ncbi:aliphatic sulfonate ABC transporter substrate-binding protein [Actinomadura darangshiensis]|uniref:Aliphatic sulfonate ABC transporter substrate-binding protein n=1 Tax=Actinomadura darangshiensis TaxID=705336 RepID=A0A4R5C153_9ACTN|nr:aliphatic sulfonate ABC transporter substrate-binding protein [Actinomadura darangshiensis]TDD91753.1 aliphatic sulfonate ABC transporter substrate-binding protein [Actinomadura darangshiensis]